MRFVRKYLWEIVLILMTLPASSSRVQPMQGQLDRQEFSSPSKAAAQCHAKLNIVFVLDGSGSIISPEWKLIQDFVIQLSSEFELGAQKTRVSVVQFSSEAKEHCKLSESLSFEDLAECVRSMRQMKFSTRSNLGLDLAQQILDEAYLAEPNDPADSQFVIFLGDGDLGVAPHDGESRKLAIQRADSIKQLESTHIFSLAVGEGAIVDQLQLIASPPIGKHKFFYQITEFDQLAEFIEPLLYVSCDSEVIGKPVGLGQGAIDVHETYEKDDSATTFGHEANGWKCGNNCITDVYYGVFSHGRKTRTGFYEVVDRWKLVATLGKQLLYQTDSKVIKKFVTSIRPVVEDALKGSDVSQLEAEDKLLLQSLNRKGTDSEFLALFSPFLLNGAMQADVNEGYTLLAEFKGLKNELLTIDLDHKSSELDDLRTALARRMLAFMQNAREIEKHPLLTPSVIELMWTTWQNAWGAVRVFAKLTTQCSVKVPQNFPGKNMKEKRATYMMPAHQHYWYECSKAKKFDVSEFPSTVATCARDDEYLPKGDAQHDHKDRDNLVRYLGCGEKRVHNPPVSQGPLTLCSNRVENRGWYKKLCDYSSEADDSCNLFGPFWAVYAGRMEQVFGWKKPAELRLKAYSKGLCHMQGEFGGNGTVDAAKCGDPQIEAFKTMLNDANNEYIYGSVPDLPVSQATAFNHNKKSIGWDEGGQAWHQPHERPRDPALGEVLREVQRGSTVVLAAYGYSGAGKTTTLVGDSSNAVDGVVSIYLKDMSRYISDVGFSAFEVYGRMSAADGSMAPGVGQGVWAYEPTAGPTHARFLGDWRAFHNKESRVDFNLVHKQLSRYKISMAEVLFNGVPQEEQDWATDIQKLLAKIENLRKTQANFANADHCPTGDCIPQAHIRGTPNNPSSSRGTLFIVLDLKFKDGQHGTIAVVDLAGAEDPAVMAAAFMKFVPDPAPKETAWTTESYTQRLRAERICGNGKTNMELINKYLRDLANDEEMDDKLAECIAFKDMLHECNPNEDMHPACAAVWLHGKKRYFRPDIESSGTENARPERWIRKSHREEHEKFKDFQWKYALENAEVKIGPIPIDEVLKAVSGANAGEGPFDRVSYVDLIGHKDFSAHPRKYPQGCDESPASRTEYKSVGRRFKRPGEQIRTDQRCAIFSCQTIYLTQANVTATSFGQAVERQADLQLERDDVNLKTGKSTGIDWRMNRCTHISKKDKTCKKINYPPGRCLPPRGGDNACRWPNRLWHREPYAIESQLFQSINQSTAAGKKAWPVYERYWKVARDGVNPKSPAREKNCAKELGGDMVGAAKSSGEGEIINYDNFLAVLAAVRDERGSQDVLAQRVLEWKKMRRDFWLALQEYLDEYKLHEEQYRNDWDKYLAYFTQTIGPMIEESLYINEMLNQMRNFLKAVSDWSENNEKDPWPKSSPHAKMGAPLSKVQHITPVSQKAYQKGDFVQEAKAQRPYYQEVQQTGQDRVLGLTMLESIRRRAVDHGAEKYKVLFGAFLRTDMPNGDPDCQGARQSLEFAQLLTESMGKSRRDYLPAMLGPKARLPGFEIDNIDMDMFAYNPESNK